MTSKTNEIISNLCVTTPTDGVDTLRTVLEDLKLNDPSRRLKFLKNENLVAIPINDINLDNLKNKIDQYTNRSLDMTEVCIRNMDLPLAKKLTMKTPQQLLKTDLKSLIETQGYTWTDDIINDIPTHWERHGDLVLIQGSTFTLPVWLQLGTNFWTTVIKCLQCKRVARKSAVSIDQYRTPQVTLLYGDTGWVEQTDNGIRYTYDVTRCMFSAGNITEKLRVAGFRCNGEIVVDLYAGIGYFTLPYLVYTGVKHLHACEWNPYAVKALQRNLILNKVDDRCTVHLGDNKQVCPRGVADRVNLGLIPSSREGWSVACEALKPDTGGILHIHYNVNTKSEARAGCHGDEPQEKFRCEAKNYRPDHSVNIAETDENVLIEKTNQNINESESDVRVSKVDSVTEKHVIDNGVGKKGGSISELTVSNVSHDIQDKTNGQETTCSYNKLANSEDKEHNESKSNKCNTSHVENSKWYTWAKQTALEIREMKQSIHSGQWTTHILHIEHVKSYAPYVDHIVLDLKCIPVNK